MKRIFVLMVILLVAAGGLRAQDSATQQQIDQINGKLQDILDAQTAQGKRLDALEKQFADLQDKVNNPTGNNYANADDVKKLAEQLQDVDKKRQDDRDLILKEIQKLGAVAAEPSTTGTSRRRDSSGDSTPNSTSTTPKTVDGYEYTVKAGDTLSIIAKAYRDQHIHVTVSQILKANPGLDATKLYVGTKIIIPKPAQ